MQRDWGIRAPNTYLMCLHTAGSVFDATRCYFWNNRPRVGRLIRRGVVAAVDRW